MIVGAKKTGKMQTCFQMSVVEQSRNPRHLKMRENKNSKRRGHFIKSLQKNNFEPKKKSIPCRIAPEPSARSIERCSARISRAQILSIRKITSRFNPKKVSKFACAKSNHNAIFCAHCRIFMRNACKKTRSPKNEPAKTDFSFTPTES